MIFIRIRRESTLLSKIFFKIIFVLKNIFYRPIASFITFYCYYIFVFKKYHKTIDNQELKKGISLCLPVKDEDSYLKICLESLLDVVDQFILIDNGSKDDSLKILNEFKEQYSSFKEIIVLEMPNANLCEVRQKSYDLVKYRYVLKWDADMFCHNHEKNNLMSLRKKLLKQHRPVAYSLRRLNLSGDLNHVNTYFDVIDQGEPFLKTYNNQFRFKEVFGRFENESVPIYYKYLHPRPYYSFHLSMARPLLRVLYRTCYLDWREAFNNGSQSIKEKYKTYDSFQKDWLLHNFQTIDEQELKYRVGRLFAQFLVLYDEKKYGPLPEEFKNNKSKTLVIYQNNQPFRVVDIEDSKNLNYVPNKKDLEWIVNAASYYNQNSRISFLQ